MTSQTSGPPARAARRPVGPDRKMIPGCSAIRKASAASRFAADDKDMPAFAATKEASRSATGGSNLTGVAVRLLMTTSESVGGAQGNPGVLNGQHLAGWGHSS